MADQKPARPEVKKTDERKSNRIKCSKPKGKPNPNNRLKKNQTNQKIVMNKEQNPAVKGKEIQKITAVSEKPLAPEQKKPVDTEASKPAEMNKELQSEFNMELKESLENLLVSLLTDGDSEEAGQKAESTLESLIPQKPEQKDLLTILTVFDEVLQNLQNQEAEETVCNLFSSSVMKDYLKQYPPFSEPKTARLLIRVYAEYKNPLNFPVNLNPERILYGYSEGNVKHSPYSCEVTEAVISQLQESDLDRLLFEWLNSLFFFDPEKVEVPRREKEKIPYNDQVINLKKKMVL